MVWKEVSKFEIEEKNERIDLAVFKKRSNSKTFPGWVIGKIKKARNEGNMEVVVLLNEIYKKYKEFETISKITLVG